MIELELLMISLVWLAVMLPDERNNCFSAPFPEIARR